MVTAATLVMFIMVIAFEAMSISTVMPEASTALGAVLPRTLPRGTFRLAGGVPSVVASRFFHSGGFNACVAYVPLFLVTATGMRLVEAGLVLAISSLTWALGSAVQGSARMAGKQQRLVVAGALCCLVSYLGYTTFAFVPGVFSDTVLASGWWVLLPCGLSGLGMGLSSASLSVLLFSYAPRQRHASASSALQLGDVLGSTLSLTVGGVLFALLSAVRLGDDGEMSSAAASWGVYDPVPFAVVWGFTALVAVGALVSAVRIAGHTRAQ